MKDEAKIKRLIENQTEGQLNGLWEYGRAIGDTELLGLVNNELAKRENPDALADELYANPPEDTPSLEDQGLSLGSYGD